MSPLNSRNLYFLPPCRQTDLLQDIVVRQFDSSAFIKVYIVGVSVICTKSEHEIVGFSGRYMKLQISYPHSGNPALRMASAMSFLSA